MIVNDVPNIQSLTPRIGAVVRLWILAPGSARSSETVMTLTASGSYGGGDPILGQQREAFRPRLFWRPVLSSPNRRSSVWLRPSEYPSAEIERSAVTLPIRLVIALSSSQRHAVAFVPIRAVLTARRRRTGHLNRRGPASASLG